METSDFYLVAYLLTKGQPLIKTHKNKTKIAFEFADTPEVERLKNEFFVGDPLISAKEFGRKIKDLKNLIHHMKNSA